jgi:hypothetical protein
MAPQGARFGKKRAYFSQSVKVYSFDRSKYSDFFKIRSQAWRKVNGPLRRQQQRNANMTALSGRSQQGLAFGSVERPVFIDRKRHDRSLRTVVKLRQA